MTVPNFETSPLNNFNIGTLPSFANDKLLYWGDLFSGLEQYVAEEWSDDRATVDLSRFVGSKHPGYAGGTWLDLLTKGKKMERNLRKFREDPEYYLDCSRKQPAMYCRSVDGGDLYIGDNGNNRVCIARFYLSSQGISMLHGLALRDYRIDWEFKKQCEEFRTKVQELRLPIYLAIKRECLERRETMEGTYSEIYTLHALVTDARLGQVYEFDKNSLASYTKSLAKPWWKVWLFLWPDKD